MRTHLLLPFFLAAPTLASNPHNNLRNIHNNNRRQPQPQPQAVTIQTDTTANNGFITTATTTDSNGDPKTMTWFTVPSNGGPAITTATVTATVTSTTSGSSGAGSGTSGSGAGSSGGQAPSTSSSTAGAARVTGVVGMGAVGAMGMGVLIVGGFAAGL